MKNIILAQPQGFCAGVKRAIDIVEKALALYGSPIYVLHEIVHNRYVVEDLESKGVIFVDRIEEIPAGSISIFSAHGVSTEVESNAKSQNLDVIDATCPLVAKVHLEAIRNDKEGRQILLIGHKGHPEVIGTAGHVAQEVQIIEKVEDIDNLQIKDSNNLSYITQTTLSVDDTKAIIEKLKEKFPNIIGPGLKDICYATQNRQDAVKALLPKVDIVLVVGSNNSSNSNRLKDLAAEYGTPSFLLDHQSKIDLSWFEDKTNIGITSGASAPQRLVDNIIEFLKSSLPIATVTTIEGKKENIEFKLPKRLLSDLNC